VSVSVEPEPTHIDGSDLWGIGLALRQLGLDEEGPDGI